MQSKFIVVRKWPRTTCIMSSIVD